MPPADRLGLFAARAIAWALLLSAWLGLGSLGAEHAVAVPGGASLPLVVWLVGVGALLAWRVGARGSPGALTTSMAVLALAGVGALVALRTGGAAAPAIVVLALAWAGLTVGASRVVHGWRRRLRNDPRLHGAALPSPAGAALAGAAIAWTAAGDLLMLRHALPGLALVLAAPVAMAWLSARAERRPAQVPAGTPGSAVGAGKVASDDPVDDPVDKRAVPTVPAGTCRAGLFDCSLPLPGPEGWRIVPRWPLHAATWAMLPMMVALPAMAAWCSDAGWSVRTTTAVHLAAMLVPGALARRWLARCPATAVAAGVTGLLVAGVAAPWFAPGLTGLMALSIVHAFAWSLAWGWQLASPEARRTAHGGQGLAGAGATAVAVVGLAAALSASGPAALTVVHGAIAALALAAWAVIAARALRAARGDPHASATAP
jgi:hypothetical protein